MARPVRELALLFLRLGVTAFGGPAAHIALMRDEVVRRRRWMDDGRFLDLLAATNLIPGPNSTEMAIHIGALRAGWPGLLVAGAGFIVPAAAIVLGLAWTYVRYGDAPLFESVLAGILPVVIAVIASALFHLGPSAVRRPQATTQRVLLVVVAAAALALYLLGVNELALMAGGGAVVVAAREASRLWAGRVGAAVWLALPWGLLGQAAARDPVDLGRLFVVMLKVGAVLYGSGYVLLAFLRTDLVQGTGWLTERELLDAVAIGQATPGPVFTTATFVGFLVGSWGGAALATLGIFLPSFLFVGLLAPLVPRLRRSPVAAAFLDGVTVAALALMAGVTLQLGREAIVDVGTALLALGAFAVLLWTRLNPAWLILVGGILGLLLPGLG